MIPEPGMAVSASLERPAATERKNEGGEFPLTEVGWQQQLTSVPEAEQYMALCRRMGSFSTEDSQRIQTAGTQLVQRVG